MRLKGRPELRYLLEGQRLQRDPNAFDLLFEICGLAVDIFLDLIRADHRVIV